MKTHDYQFLYLHSPQVKIQSWLAQIFKFCDISDNLYGDVSGLPDPYMGQPGGDPMMMQQPPPQQQQQHQYHGHQMPPPPPPGGAMGGGQFDDSQDENDFSPNGKSRRIIREIIV